MKVFRVEMSDDATKAVITLRPSWLARLLGARDRVAELVWKKADDGWSFFWWCARTGVRVDFMRHGVLITYALQFQPVRRAKLPEAKVVTHVTRSNPLGTWDRPCKVCSK